jgi:RimJ/RimL family protein N-acetyltransferase
VIRGRKVALRAVERADLQKVWELRNDAEIEANAFGPPTPHSMAEIEAWFERLHAPANKDHVFVIEADGRFVGTCNLRDVDALNRRADLGISLLPDEIGKGFGSDAIRVLLEYTFVHLNLHKLCLDTLETNEAALRAYRACGFVEEGRLREHEWASGRFVDLILMSVLRDDWLAGRDAAGQVTLR